MISVPPEIQDKIVQFEQLRKQLQVVTAQRMQLEGERDEVKDTLKVLEETKDDTTIYKSSGNLLMKVDDKNKLIEELKDQLETLELRVKTMKSQEERIKERFDAIQKEISEAITMLQAQQGMGGFKTQ